MCSVLTSLVFYKKDKVFAIYSGEFCCSFVLFDRVSRPLSMICAAGQRMVLIACGTMDGGLRNFSPCSFGTISARAIFVWSVILL